MKDTGCVERMVEYITYKSTVIKTLNDNISASITVLFVPLSVICIILIDNLNFLVDMAQSFR